MVALVTEPERKGKTSANHRDTREGSGRRHRARKFGYDPESRAVEFLVHPSTDSRIGVVAAGPIPVGESNQCMGSMVTHSVASPSEVSILEPKTGEMFAFRPTPVPSPHGLGQTKTGYVIASRAIVPASGTGLVRSSTIPAQGL